MSAVDDAAVVGVLTVAPDGSPMPTPVLVDGAGSGFMRFTCADCGHDVSFVNPTAQRVQWYATTHRCGGPTWQG